ncbi:MAG: hypothetical protein V4615_08680, partial [Bacteroidota bacterium]
MRNLFFFLFVACIALIPSCKKELNSIANRHYSEQKYYPLSLTDYFTKRIGTLPMNDVSSRSASSCNFPWDEIHSMIDSLQFYLEQDYGFYQASYLCDTLRLHVQKNPLFIEAPIESNSPAFFSDPDRAIDWALSQSPLPVTRVDSAARIVNYVFTHYSYGVGSLLNPAAYANMSMKTIGREIAANRLAGMCGDLTNFLGIVITTKFPWWGTPVTLSTQPNNGIGHTFSGLADRYGNVYMVMDPTTNVVWVDYERRPLTLDKIQNFLMNNPTAVYEMSATVFGDKQKQFSESPCLFYFDCESGSATFAFEPNTDSYVIRAKWYGFNATSGLMYRALVEPLWSNWKLPGNSWANHCLMIDFVACPNPNMAKKILFTYGSYVLKKNLV